MKFLDELNCNCFVSVEIPREGLDINEIPREGLDINEIPREGSDINHHMDRSYRVQT